MHLVYTLRSTSLSFYLSFCLSALFLSVQCRGAIPPHVLVELLVIKEYIEWGEETSRAMDGRDAVITESMQLAGIVLTFQSCTLLSKDVSYGPISL